MKKPFILFSMLGILIVISVVILINGIRDNSLRELNTKDKKTEQESMPSNTIDSVNRDISSSADESNNSTASNKATNEDSTNKVVEPDISSEIKSEEDSTKNDNVLKNKNKNPDLPSLDTERDGMFSIITNLPWLKIGYAVLGLVITALLFITLRTFVTIVGWFKDMKNDFNRYLSNNRHDIGKLHASLNKFEFAAQDKYNHLRNMINSRLDDISMSIEKVDDKTARLIHISTGENNNSLSEQDIVKIEDKGNDVKEYYMECLKNNTLNEFLSNYSGARAEFSNVDALKRRGGDYAGEFQPQLRKHDHGSLCIVSNEGEDYVFPAFPDGNYFSKQDSYDILRRFFEIRGPLTPDKVKEHFKTTDLSMPGTCERIGENEWELRKKGIIIIEYVD